ncbi:MAG: Swt1 family HEPN domain-containing protein [Gammaproteobacteria bacterium]
MQTRPLEFLTHQLVQILKNTLPVISPDWWESLVIKNLTFSQQTFAREQRQQSLEQLDLAALLRVVDQNWYDLSRQLGLNASARNWLKEAMTIRNRWAHAPAGSLDDDAIYRDLDTIERLLQAFGASAEVLGMLHQDKQSLMSKLASGSESLTTSQTPNGAISHEKQHRPACRAALF